MMEEEVRYQTCMLSDALHRNITDSFESVSLEILEDGNIQTKFVLSKLTEVEEEYLHDLIGEFEAVQDENWVLKAMIEVGDSPPLEHLVYRKGVLPSTKRSEQ